MIDELVHMYEKGAITADHLVIELLHKIDPSEPGIVLSSLPPAVLERMLAYANQYRSGGMRTNYGLQPASEQVAAAKRWIESSLRDSNATAGLKPDCVERP